MSEGDSINDMLKDAEKLKGRKVEINVGKRVIRGIFLGVNKGRIKVRDENNMIHMVLVSKINDFAFEEEEGEKK
ncbi:hypothetical protein SPV3_ORF44 [Sulfolobus polyhedral virus 3]|nr:hypothetical protein SPV3_ORF44 [Sulfolobus polyhedral virus 3]